MWASGPTIQANKIRPPINGVATSTTADGSRVSNPNMALVLVIKKPCATISTVPYASCTISTCWVRRATAPASPSPDETTSRLSAPRTVRRATSSRNGSTIVANR